MVESAQILDPQLGSPIVVEDDLAAARIDPNDPHWGVWTGVGVWAFSVVAIVIFPGVFLFPYIAASGVKFASNEQMVEYAKTDPTAILVQVASVIPAHIVTILLAWFVVTKVRRYSFLESLGWTSGGLRWWHYLAILVGFFILAAVVGHYFPEQENDVIRILRSSRTTLFVFAFMATFTAPLVEEVVYRGILFSPLQRKLGAAAAVGFVTAIFAAVHVPQYWESGSTIFLLTLLSLVLTVVRAHTGSLLPCVIIHTLINASQSVLLIIEPWVRQLESAETATTVFK
jgi:membrane protease YdiL (CAAX protease family)